MRHIPGHRNPSLRIDGRSVSKNHSWNNVWDTNNRFVTFFLQNFPETCSWENLRAKLQEIESVRDLFIPQRRDKKGKRFGFVRFGRDIDIRGVEDKLNNIWFDSFKLRENISKFSKDLGKTSAKDGGTSRFEVTHSAFREDNKSYKEAFRGRLIGNPLSPPVGPLRNLA